MIILVTLGRAEGTVAPGLEELLHRQGLGIDAAPDAAPAFAPGQTLAGRHDVPADGLAAVFGLEVEVEQMERSVLHLPCKVADEAAAEEDEEVVHIVVDVLFNSVGALQVLDEGVQLLCGKIAFVDLVPDLAGKVGGHVDIFGLGDQLVIGFHSPPEK